MNTCSVPWCDKRVNRRGFCMAHAKRSDLGMDMDAPLRSRRPKGRTCVVEGCGRPHLARGLCQPHYDAGVKRHGLSRAQREELISGQGGLCAACSSVLRDPKIDHDHRHCASKQGCSDCVRGVLCQNCNIALGMVKDSPDRLRLLIAYLAAWETKKPPAKAGGNS